VRSLIAVLLQGQGHRGAVLHGGPHGVTQGLVRVRVEQHDRVGGLVEAEDGGRLALAQLVALAEVDIGDHSHADPPSGG
jgi:hypothetical protein